MILDVFVFFHAFVFDVYLSVWNISIFLGISSHWAPSSILGREKNINCRLLHIFCILTKSSAIPYILRQGLKWSNINLWATQTLFPSSIIWWMKECLNHSCMHTKPMKRSKVFIFILIFYVVVSTQWILDSGCLHIQCETVEQQIGGFLEETLLSLATNYATAVAAAQENWKPQNCCKKGTFSHDCADLIQDGRIKSSFEDAESPKTPNSMRSRRIHEGRLTCKSLAFQFCAFDFCKSADKKLVTALQMPTHQLTEHIKIPDTYQLGSWGLCAKLSRFSNLPTECINTPASENLRLAPSSSPPS